MHSDISYTWKTTCWQQLFCTAFEGARWTVSLTLQNANDLMLDWLYLLIILAIDIDNDCHYSDQLKKQWRTSVKNFVNSPKTRSCPGTGPFQSVMIKKLTDTYAHFDVLLLLSFIDNALDAGNMFTWYKDPSAESFSRQGFPLRDAYEINDATSMSATKRENEIKDWMCAEAEGQENNLTSCIFIAACSPSHYDADNFPHCMAFIYCSCPVFSSVPISFSITPFFYNYGC